MKRFKIFAWLSVATIWLLLITLQLLPPEFVYQHFVVSRAQADITDLTGYTGKIGQEDINFATGQDSDTFTIVGYNGATVTLTTVPALVANIASIIKGKWYVEQITGDQCNVLIDGSVAWIIDVIAGDNVTIELPGNYSYTCDTTYEIPTNIVTKIQNGATFTLDDGVTLTVSGKLDLSETSSTVFAGTAGGATSTVEIDGGMMAGANQQIFDATNLTVDLSESKITKSYLEWFGGGIGVAAATNSAAYTALHDAYYPIGGAWIQLGNGTYSFSDEWQVTAPIHISGVMPSSYTVDDSINTVMFFATDKKGIVLNAHNTYDGVKGSTDDYTGANYSIIDNVIIKSAGGTANVDGIYSNIKLETNNIVVQDFPRYGIQIAASTAIGGNTNNWQLNHTRIETCGSDGLYVQGSDANAGIAINISSAGNTGWGINDESSFGSVYITGNLDSNTGGSIRTTGGSASHVIIGMYSETAGAMPDAELVFPTTVIGGVLAASGSATTASTHFNLYGGLATRRPFRYLSESGTYDVSSTLGVQSATMEVLSWGSSDESAAMDATKLQYDANKWWALENVSRPMIRFPNTQSAPAHFAPFLDKGIHIGGIVAAGKPIIHTSGTAFPTTKGLTFEDGARVYDTTAVLGAAEGWECTEAGTQGTLNAGATTGGITNGTTALVVNAATDLLKWQYITIAGVTGIKKITAISGLNVTIDSAADATVAAAAVAFSNATSAEFGNISLEGTIVWDPGDLADGAGETSASITATGAALGDYVLVAAPYDLQDLIATGYVQATNTVEIRIQNENAGANVNLASGTWKVKVMK